MTCSLLSRVSSGVLVSRALCIVNHHVRNRPLSLGSTPSRIGSSACFLPCVIWVCLTQAGAHWGVKLRWFGLPPSVRVLLISPCLSDLASTCVASTTAVSSFKKEREKMQPCGPRRKGAPGEQEWYWRGTALSAASTGPSPTLCQVECFSSRTASRAEPSSWRV